MASGSAVADSAGVGVILLDRVFIKGLTVATTIGVYEWERKIRQNIALDLEMGWDNSKAAASDDLSKALDYASVSSRITELLESAEFLLVERLAEQVAERVISEFSIPWLKLTVYKPGAVANAESVGVIIERSQQAATHG